VVAESGEAVLVAADPDRHHELGRFQAIEGKTWNHLVIAHGRLCIRNAEEMACYEMRCRTAFPGRRCRCRQQDGLERPSYTSRPNEVVEKNLGVPATTRDWNTIAAICRILNAW
jgi:hypothetical protein